MQLSCTSFSFPLLPLEKVLDVVAVLDLPLVDLCVVDSDREVRTRDILRDPAGTAALHRNWLDKRSLSVGDVFAHLGTGPFDRPISTTSAVPDNRHRLHAYLRYASRVGSPGLTMSPGYASEEGGWATAVAELNRLVDAADRQDLRVRVEPHSGSLAATVDDALALCDAVPGLSLTLDYSHFIAHGVPQDTVDRLWPSATHAHLRQAAPGAVQAAAENGTIDVGAWWDAASAAGFAGSVALEYIHSPLWGQNRVDVVSETIRLRDRLHHLEQGAPE